MLEKDNKIVSIHQPNYIPWLGYFYKIFQSDVFVFLDDAQFSNKGQQNFHYLKTPQGQFRLKIPVKQSLGDNINEVVTKDEMNWKEKHLKTLEMNYKKAPFFEGVYSDFKKILDVQYQNLAVQNEEIVKFICEKFGIKTIFVESSSLQVKAVREERIIDICKELDATIYYSGTGARAYQDEKNFSDQGIELRYSEYLPFEYSQLWSNEFMANVSVMDYLMNHGYDWQKVIDHQKKII